MPDLAFVLVVIFVALVFDFINGFHDSANSIATIVATGVLKPRNAVLLAAFWNFAGAFIFSVAVATTIGKNVIDPSSVTISIILAALLGGLIGAGMAGAGIGAVHFSCLKTILVFIVVAPVLGFIGALLLTIIMMWTLRRVSPSRMDWSFKKLQLVSSSAYSLSHGTNDAQKTMGVITLVLLTSGMISEFHVPVWVILSSYTAIALGTFFGGWRIVRTMGLRITKLRPFHGCMAETAGSAVLLSTAHFGIPVSTTHVISGSIMGVGTVRRSSGVRWQIARKIVVAWLLTIPVSALAGALAYAGLSLVV